MNDFKKLLEQFDAALRKYNPVNYTKLQPPLAKKEINKYLTSFGIESNDELKLLFSWKNGFNFSKGEDSSYRIWDYGALLSLEHLNLYAQHETEPEIDDKGKRNFLRLTTNGGGEALMYSIQEEGYGKIYLAPGPPHFFDEPVSYYDSLSAMIETTIQAYKELIFTYDEADDWLDIDLNKYYPLAKRINKNSDYWKKE